MIPTYKLAKNPSDGLWYVVGHTGRGIYIPVSEGYRTKREATAFMANIKRADLDAVRLVPR